MAAPIRIESLKPRPTRAGRVEPIVVARDVVGRES